MSSKIRAFQKIITSPALTVTSVLMVLCTSYTISGQNLEQIGKAKLFKVTGGLAANSIFYEGTANREPFTYFLSGSINLNISGVYNLPFSFSYTNQKFNSSNPFSFNRLSLHPTYKWVATHIGDVSMSFSPYTLSGHQFTGLGTDLSPEGPIKFSAMYGRLLKESEYTIEDPRSEPAYKRMGYGFKTLFTEDIFGIGVIVFRASDQQNSIKNPVPIELELQAKENIVGSIEGNVKLFERGTISVEYASSLITEDINAGGSSANNHVLSPFITTNASTRSYVAYNANFTYQVGQGTVGAGYEHVDPEYRTFGAYFFNNDLENITVNASQTIFDGKVSIAVNGGLQRDDLNNAKSSQMQRVVSAVNLTYAPTEKLNLAGGYSNFQSYTNIKNQFDLINEVSLSDNLDTLDFQQVSQNATLNANYILKDSETKSKALNIDFSYQGAMSKQGGAPTENGISNFYNASTTYTVGYPESSLSISGSLNTSYNTIGTDNSLIFGPSLSTGKQFFDKRLRTTGSISYNQSQNNGEKQSGVTNLRINGAYSVQKKHNLSLTILSQLRTAKSSTQDFTVTLGYNYVFDKIDPNIKFPKRKKKGSPLDTALIEFTYRDSIYGKTQSEIDQQLAMLQNHPHFAHIPSYKKEGLTAIRTSLSQINKAGEYKLKTIQFLEGLYSYEDFITGYNELVFSILSQLRRDMQRLDYMFEKTFVRAKVKVDNHSLHKRTSGQRARSAPKLREGYQNALQNSEAALARLVGHRWMLPIITGYDTLDAVENPDALLLAVMEKEKDAMFRMWDEAKTAPEIELYLITKIIDFYWKESVKHTDPDAFELKYIEKK